MQIDHGSVSFLQVPLADVYSSAHHPDLDTLQSILVTVSDDRGRRGIGTADTVQGYSQHTHETVQREAVDLLRHLSAEQPRNYTQFRESCKEVSPESNAKAAVETAFLDLYARRRGVTLGELFGGTLADEQRLNAWVGFDDPDAMAAEATEWNDRGFDSLKIKLTGERDLDIERIRAVCGAVGEGMEVRADANCAYEDADDAIEVACAVEDCPLSHFEQPTPEDDVHGLKRVTDATSVPVMADECLTDLSRVHEVLSEGAADRLKLKLLRLGGFATTRTALDLAELHDVACVVGHGFCLTPAASAELQFTLSHGNVYAPVETVGPLKTVDEPFTPALEIEDGRMRLPSGPGTGIELDEERLDDVLRSRETIP